MNVRPSRRSSTSFSTDGSARTTFSAGTTSPFVQFCFRRLRLRAGRHVAGERELLSSGVFDREGGDAGATRLARR